MSKKTFDKKNNPDGYDYNGRPFWIAKDCKRVFSYEEWLEKEKEE